MQNNSITSQTDIANVTVITEENQIIVPQPITNVVEVNNPGPRGPQGPAGAAGPSVPFTNIGGDVYATTSSLQVSGSFLVSGSSTFTNIGPAIFSGSTSLVGATTMSSAIVSGNVTVLGTASIGTLVVNQTVLSTGSNQLGDSANDTQTLYGSVIVPTGSLTVTGSINATSIVKASSLQASGISTLATTFYYGYLTEDNNSNRIYLNANELDFWTNGSSTMRITKATKNILIGTTTDSGFRLDVSGSARVSDMSILSNSGTTTSTLTFFANGNTTNSYGYIRTAFGASSNFGRIEFGTRFLTSTSTKMTLDENGNLGIGISSSPSKLYISGSTSQALLIASSSAGTALFVSGSGNIGIGTGTPSENLHVSGNILIGQYPSSTSVLRFANISDSGNSAFIGRTAAAGFEIQPGSVSEFRINTPAGADTNPLTIFGNGVRTAQFYRNSRTRFGGNLSTNPGSTVEIAGEGATASTTALTVQNSSATPLLRVINDASIFFGGASVGLFPSTNKGQSVNSGAGGLFIGYAASGDLSYPEIPSVTIGRPNDRLLNSTSGTTIMGSVVGNYSPTSGTGAFTTLEVVPTINQTGGANGITRGLYVNPTLTSAANFRAIETTAGNVLFGTTASGFFWDNTNTGLVLGGGSLDTNQVLQINGAKGVRISGASAGFGYSLVRGSEIGGLAANTTFSLLYSTTQLRFETAANERMRIDSSGNVGIGTTSPSYTLDVSGSAGSTARFRGSAGQSTVSLNDGTNDNIIVGLSGRLQLRPSGNTTFTALATGEIGIGTTTPIYKLDVSGSTRVQGTINMSGSLTDNNLIDYSGSLYGTRFRLRDWAWNLAAGVSLDSNNIFLNPNAGGEVRTSGNYLIVGANATSIGAGYSSLTTRLTVRGQGATNATTTFLLQNSTPTNLLSVLDNGQVAFTSPTMSLAASQSAFSISPIISASNIVGGQYYGVSITPTFFQTTGSQTETAFRVAATFTQSSATATSGTNIIADFGSTSAGSQLTVTDVTSGSIYMVNDVSGIPIIEATSNWDVNMYDFPNKIFEKTGSQVNIYGTMRVSGSFILPLSQSIAPQTGSAYWSGSLLFIYDGTRYRSSSFA